MPVLQRLMDSKDRVECSLPHREEFCRKYNITAPDRMAIAEAEWPELEAIFKRYSVRLREFEWIGSIIADRIKNLSQVHSLRVRVKDPEHLVEKIIRKRSEDPERIITQETYDTAITDLSGVRILHLFKDDWASVHQFVTSTWELNEKPIAYIREGDPREHVNRFTEAGCDVRPHPKGYRSIHYVIKSQPSKQLHLTELQVRTIFEEGWSEIDHKIRYPYLTDDPVLSQFLVLFNRAAGNADEMGTFIKNLAQQMDLQRSEKEEKEKALFEMISKLEIAQQKKEELEHQLQQLTTVQVKAESDWIMSKPIEWTQGRWLNQSVYVDTGTMGTVSFCRKCGNYFGADGHASNLCPQCRPRIITP